MSVILNKLASKIYDLATKVFPLVASWLLNEQLILSPDKNVVFVWLGPQMSISLGRGVHGSLCLCTCVCVCVREGGGGGGGEGGRGVSFIKGKTISDSFFTFFTNSCPSVCCSCFQVGPPDMFDIHQKLIELRKQEKDLEVSWVRT